MKVDHNLPVLFSHPVYQYFGRRYGLNGRSLHWEPQEMPSIAMWGDLTALLEEHPAKWMIWEAEPSSQIKAKLAAQGVQCIVFDPCAGVRSGGDFISVMKLNTAALKTVFGRQ